MISDKGHTQPGISPDARIHESVYIDEGVRIGARSAIWHFSHVQRGATIGSDCTLGQNVNVANAVTIGNHAKIQNNVSIYEGVTLEDYVFIGPSVVFTNVLVPRGKVNQRGAEFYRQTIVREGAAIGANATIVCGHDIGRSALIAAGAVVTKAVKDYAVVMGVPAVQTAWICTCGEKLSFPLSGHVSEISKDDLPIRKQTEKSHLSQCAVCRRSYLFTPDLKEG